MNDIIIAPELQHRISPEVANHYRVLPKEAAQNELHLYIDATHTIIGQEDELELLLGCEVKFHNYPAEKIEKALQIYYRKSLTESNKSFDIDKADFLENLMQEAKNLGSSDIHFEVYEEEARIRFRIDGQLIERYKIKMENYLELVNKVKIKSKLNITEKRLPQDGRIKNKNFDIRVSILPTLFGEKIVMRLLGNDASDIDLNKLGFEGNEQLQYLEGIKKPNGIILISGPTGSGKTTTLYATLKLLNDSKRNIVTVEDPIEYTLKGINQVQLKEDIGLTFSSALRSFLRQDPDIIMLGEIRDSETALMAIRASLTGHLVLSTIHTNSALGTISRLADMGVPLYLIAETLNLSVAQRLVRKLCNNCKKPAPLVKENFPPGYKFPYDGDTVYVPVGCNHCFHTGYKGRRAVYEVLSVDFETAGHIKDNNLKSIYTKKHKSLSDKAFDILMDGESSLDEIYALLINT
ncbi:GspE/PulE family protein [Flavobacterium rhizosphaerae]|uniref:GspE/PulE family protein n=1 Tax=Flavobacterium rhizosphaerae TaxID=3163298 RepID=A0ABW8YTA2_9FLAO